MKPTLYLRSVFILRKGGNRVQRGINYSHDAFENYGISTKRGGANNEKENVISCSCADTVASIFMLAALPVLGDDPDPNTVSSSSMIFQGTLTPDGDGSYTGTIPMVDEAALAIGDKEAGFDVYAKDGAKATYYSDSGYLCGVVAGHDAYNTGGGWGDFYDPDCADWEHYQLKFDGDTWAVEYASGGTAYCAPLSGSMDWVARYARETGAGAYYEGTGTPADDGYALNNTCTGTKTGEGAWDMDWSWGSEYIPLQSPGFDVVISGQGGGVYRVKLVPASASVTQLSVEVPDILAISVNPTSIDYGTLLPGATSETKSVVVTNIGTRKVDVSIAVDPSTGVWQYLQLYKGSWATGAWADFITDLVMNGTSNVPTRLPVPASYEPNNEENATLLFTVEASD